MHDFLILQTALIKKEFKLEKLRSANLIVIGEPKALFTPDEINILRQYFEEGGNLLPKNQILVNYY